MPAGEVQPDVTMEPDAFLRVLAAALWPDPVELSTLPADRIRVVTSIVGDLAELGVLTGWSDDQLKLELGCTKTEAEVLSSVPIQELEACHAFMGLVQSAILEARQTVVAADESTVDVGIERAQDLLVLVVDLFWQTGRNLDRTREALFAQTYVGERAIDHARAGRLGRAGLVARSHAGFYPERPVPADARYSTR